MNLATKTIMMISGALVWAQSPAEPGGMAFDVVSVKQSKPGAFFGPNFPLDAGDAFIAGGTGESPRGRFRADFPLSTYISFAWKLSLTPEQRQAMIAHLPKWVSTDNFEIEARAEGNPTKDQMRLMMRSLLAERFHLAVHFETHEAPVLALALVKSGRLGPNLHLHADGPPCDAPPGSDVFPPRCDVQMFTTKDQRNLAGSRNTTMELLAASLTGLGRLSRPVVDQTRIVGRVDFRIEWIVEPEGSSAPAADGVTFVDALREQLGLKLEATKAPVQTLVVDRVERSSEN